MIGVGFCGGMGQYFGVMVQLRSLKRISGICSKLMNLHDSVADLKSYFDGHGEHTESQLVFLESLPHCPVQIPYHRVPRFGVVHAYDAGSHGCSGRSKNSSQWSSRSRQR